MSGWPETLRPGLLPSWSLPVALPGEGWGLDVSPGRGCCRPVGSGRKRSQAIWSSCTSTDALSVRTPVKAARGDSVLHLAGTHSEQDQCSWTTCPWEALAVTRNSAAEQPTISVRVGPGNRRPQGRPDTALPVAAKMEARRSPLTPSPPQLPGCPLRPPPSPPSGF